MTIPAAEQIAALRAIADAIVEAVKAAGPVGAPSGVIYAALMASGCTLAQYESIMSAMVRSGIFTRHGDLYRVAPATRRAGA
jgi:hypothetical protein